jgi:hypothetical protein
MKLELHRLTEHHPKLQAHPIRYAQFGALALHRAKHAQPASMAIHDAAKKATSEVTWQHPTEPLLTSFLDDNAITEHGAEAVALAYVHASGAWQLKRRVQRGEAADWLLQRGPDALLLEVSGLAHGTTAQVQARLRTKITQVHGATLPAAKLAVVVGFESPILCASAA